MDQSLNSLLTFYLLLFSRLLIKAGELHLNVTTYYGLETELQTNSLSIYKTAGFSVWDLVLGAHPFHDNHDKDTRFCMIMNVKVQGI